MESILNTDIILVKNNEEDYFLSNINYIEIKQEKLFDILNPNGFLLKKVKNINILDNTKLKVEVIKSISENIEDLNILTNIQLKTINTFIDNNLEIRDDNYFLFILKVEETLDRIKFKKMSFNSIQEEAVIEDVYNNILNIQNNEYYDFINHLIIITNNVYVDETDLIDFNEGTKSLSFRFKTVTKKNPSKLEDGKEILLSKNKVEFISILE